MKKVVIGVLVFGWFLFPIDMGGKNKPDQWKDFVISEETIPVPGFMKTGFDSIKQDEVAVYLRFISSDLMEGRDTASRGFGMASEFAAVLFSLWGIEPAGDRSATNGRRSDKGYFQDIEMKEVLSSDSHMVVRWTGRGAEKTRTFQSDVDFIYFSNDTSRITGQVVFVGYGISEKKHGYDAYRNLDVSGKIVMMLTEIPRKGDPDSPFNRKEFKEKYRPRRGHRMVLPKIKIARRKGATAVLLVENSPAENGDVADRIINKRMVNDEKPVVSVTRRRISLIEESDPMPWETVPYIRISRETADVILGFSNRSLDQLQSRIERDMKPHSFQLKNVTLTLKNRARTRLLRCRNVLGLVEGSDPVLRDEVVVVGAHLDHLGKRGEYIFNGADDNGSGSAAVLEIAEAFSRNPAKPKRSILFALWTGEEVGLLGSRYFVHHPVFPNKKTVACLNLDMVGRDWTLNNLKRVNQMWRLGLVDSVLNGIDLENFLTLVMDRRSHRIHQALEKSNRYLGLTIYARKSASRSMGSDHSPFARKNIPWIFFFSATTEDYHQPSDSFEKVSPELIERYARLAYLTAFELADQSLE